MTLLELLHQITDACNQDGNLNREVVIVSKEHGTIKPLSVFTEHPKQIIIKAE
jgi:hypothetical protein